MSEVRRPEVVCLMAVDMPVATTSLWMHISMGVRLRHQMAHIWYVGSAEQCHFAHLCIFADCQQHRVNMLTKMCRVRMEQALKIVADLNQLLQKGVSI